MTSPHISAKKELGDAFCPGQINVLYALDQQLILLSPLLLWPHLQRIVDVEASLGFGGLWVRHPLCLLKWDGEELDWDHFA